MAASSEPTVAEPDLEILIEELQPSQEENAAVAAESGDLGTPYRR